jgi:benzoyl-CoA reductase/2-hydroxyglutaryl-CoA dehydratase subunit BcrC/BadD/HgdB
MISGSMNLQDLQILIALTAMGAGLCSLAAGILVLASSGFSRDMHTLAAQSAKLGAKAVTHDVAGLVTDVSDILSMINQLTKTSTGIGVFLMAMGIAMMGAAYFIVLQIHWIR